MASAIVNQKVQCAHAHHLFAHPLCKKQSLAKRVAHLAFHILTLAIPLIIYRLTHRKVVKIHVEPPKPEATVEKPKAAVAAPLPNVSVEPV
jgi:dolichol kinase